MEHKNLYSPAGLGDATSPRPLTLSSPIPDSPSSPTHEIMSPVVKHNDAVTTTNGPSTPVPSDDEDNGLLDGPSIYENSRGAKGMINTLKQKLSYVRELKTKCYTVLCLVVMAVVLPLVFILINSRLGGNGSIPLRKLGVTGDSIGFDAYGMHCDENFTIATCVGDKNPFYVNSLATKSSTNLTRGVIGNRLRINMKGMSSRIVVSMQPNAYFEWHWTNFANTSSITVVILKGKPGFIYTRAVVEGVDQGCYVYNRSDDSQHENLYKYIWEETPLPFIYLYSNIVYGYEYELIPQPVDASSSVYQDANYFSASNTCKPAVIANPVSINSVASNSINFYEAIASRANFLAYFDTVRSLEPDWYDQMPSSVIGRSLSIDRLLDVVRYCKSIDISKNETSLSPAPCPPGAITNHYPTTNLTAGEVMAYLLYVDNTTVPVRSQIAMALQKFRVCQFQKPDPLQPDCDCLLVLYSYLISNPYLGGGCGQCSFFLDDNNPGPTCDCWFDKYFYYVLSVSLPCKTMGRCPFQLVPSFFVFDEKIRAARMSSVRLMVDCDSTFVTVIDYFRYLNF